MREWTAGEFYWVLRTFYTNVQLLTIKQLNKALKELKMNADYKPVTEKAGILSKEHILIAMCLR